MLGFMPECTLFTLKRVPKNIFIPMQRGRATTIGQQKEEAGYLHQLTEICGKTNCEIMIWMSQNKGVAKQYIGVIMNLGEEIILLHWLWMKYVAIYIMKYAILLSVDCK